MDATYLEKRDRLARQVEAAGRRGVPIALRKSTSNLFRSRPGHAGSIDVRCFNRVLSIDPARKIAEVEGMATYESVVGESLRLGLLPAVTPQLKTITVGGAVSGLGIESSSFRHGLVHETVEEMEVLLADGRVVPCSRSENADLFYGFPNSYGTLGYALRLTIRLMEAAPFVKLTHTRFEDPCDYFRAIDAACDHAEKDFLDGTVFAPDQLFLTTGEFVHSAPATSNYRYLRIYYQSIRERRSDVLTAEDYIWRWDTDWFWCSKQFHAQNPLVRFLATPLLLNSRTYQRLMRAGRRLFAGDGRTEPVIQDVDIPIANAGRFLNFLFTEIGIQPIWICPFCSRESYPLYQLTRGELYINFGFWDVIPSARERGYHNRRVEQAALEMGGKKALYSTSYYDREAFWRIYNLPAYEALKTRFDPGHLLRDLYEKCVENQ